MQSIQNKQPSDGSLTFLLIFVGGWAVFSLIFMMIGFLIIRGETYLYDQLTQDGQLTQGIITKLTIDNSDESTGYYVTYEFKAPVNGDPTAFKHTEYVSAAFYNSLHIEQRLEVIYVASDPTIVRLKSQITQPNTTTGWVFVGFGGFFLLVGLVSGLVVIMSRSKSG